MTETAVQLYQPQTMTEYQDLGKIIAASKMFEDVIDENRAIVRVMAGAELGFPAIYSITKIHLVKGKIVVGYEAMGRMIKLSGKYNYRVVEWTDEKCELHWLENGDKVLENTFTIEDAKRAELVKQGGNWEKWRKAMLFSKALSQGARVVCPEVIGGAYTAEDMGLDSQQFADSVIEGQVREIPQEPEPREPAETPAETISDKEFSEVRKWLGMTTAKDVFKTLGIKNQQEFVEKYPTKIAALDALGQALGKDWRNRCDIEKPETPAEEPEQKTNPPMVGGKFYCDECGQETDERRRYGDQMICLDCSMAHSQAGGGQA